MFCDGSRHAWPEPDSPSTIKSTNPNQWHHMSKSFWEDMFCDRSSHVWQDPESSSTQLCIKSTNPSEWNHRSWENLGMLGQTNAKPTSHLSMLCRSSCSPIWFLNWKVYHAPILCNVHANKNETPYHWCFPTLGSQQGTRTSAPILCNVHANKR